MTKKKKRVNNKIFSLLLRFPVLVINDSLIKVSFALDSTLWELSAEHWPFLEHYMFQNSTKEKWLKKTKRKSQTSEPKTLRAIYLAHL